MRWMKKAAAAVMAMFVFLPVYAESSISPKTPMRLHEKIISAPGCPWRPMMTL